MQSGVSSTFLVLSFARFGYGLGRQMGFIWRGGRYIAAIGYGAFGELF